MIWQLLKNRNNKKQEDKNINITDIFFRKIEYKKKESS